MKTITPSKPRTNGKHPDLAKAVSKTLAEQVKEDEAKRAAACMEDINAALKKHGCSLQVVPHVVINGQPAGVLVKPNPVA